MSNHQTNIFKSSKNLGWNGCFMFIDVYWSSVHATGTLMLVVTDEGWFTGNVRVCWSGKTEYSYSAVPLRRFNHKAAPIENKNGLWV